MKVPVPFGILCQENKPWILWWNANPRFGRIQRYRWLHSTLRTFVWSLYIHVWRFTCIKKHCLFLSTILYSLACFIMGLLNMLQIHGFVYTWLWNEWSLVSSEQVSHFSVTFRLKSSDPFFLAFWKKNKPDFSMYRVSPPPKKKNVSATIYVYYLFHFYRKLNQT